MTDDTLTSQDVLAGAAIALSSARSNQLLEPQAKAALDAIALLHNDRSSSYRERDRCANQLAPAPPTKGLAYSGVVLDLDPEANVIARASEDQPTALGDAENLAYITAVIALSEVFGPWNRSQWIRLLPAGGFVDITGTPSLACYKPMLLNSVAAATNEATA